MENSNSDSTYSYSYANNKKGGEGAKVTRVKQPHPVRNAVLVVVALLLFIVLSTSIGARCCRSPGREYVHR